jgi:energy-coupling factor transport system permease protein
MNGPVTVFDVRAWFAWVLAGSIAVMVARNPVYSLIVLLAARLVDSRCARRDQSFNLPFGRLAFFVLSLSALFNMAFVHLGPTVLWRLPAGWPLIGGPLTLEAAIAGMANGLIILALLALFFAFNSIVRTGDLVRLVPNAFHDLSIVVLIALTYVPETARHWQRIREAQAVRGHQLRGWRDWRPLLVPLFVGGLERALTLSESLVARGFNAPVGRPLSAWWRGLFLATLVLALLGWGLAIWWGGPGWLVLIGAGLFLMILIRQAGRRVSRTVYRPGKWQRPDTILVGIAVVILLLLVFGGTGGGQYDPYLSLSLPPFDLLTSMALLLLAYPALVGAGGIKLSGKRGSVQEMDGDKK